MPPRFPLSASTSMIDDTPEPDTPAPEVRREELRRLHLEMIAGVMAGDGLVHIADLAAQRLHAPVAILGPRLGSVIAGAARANDQLPELQSYLDARLRHRPGKAPSFVAGEAPIGTGEELVGLVLCLASPELAPDEIADCLHAAAVAALTEFAIGQTRNEVERTVRSSLLEDLLAASPIAPEDVLRRAHRIGTNLTRGAVALCAELDTTRPRQALATIVDEHPGALGEFVGGRLYVLFPAIGENPESDTSNSARRVGARLKAGGQVGISSYHHDPGLMSRALQEAELMLEVLQHTDGPEPEQVASSTYRLLFRMLVSNPEEIKRFYQDTVASLVGYDDQYDTDLIGTLEAYLANDCNMNATAAAIYAHRHTIAYRLDRIRELTGLDPMRSEDRERLGLGLKAYRIIQPRLAR